MPNIKINDHEIYFLECTNFSDYVNRQNQYTQVDLVKV